MFVPLPEYHEYPVDAMRQRAAEFYDEVRRRRTVREFSDRPVPRDVVEDCLRAAGTAPSGANMQPWHFVVVSDAAIKRRIRAEIGELRQPNIGECIATESTKSGVVRKMPVHP